jgi:hypothetical protein
MEYFYYALQGVMGQSHPNSTASDSLYNQNYEFMASNWHSMKESNKQILDFYQEAGTR